MEQGGAEWKWWEKEGGIGWNMVEYGGIWWKMVKNGEVLWVKYYGGTM